jgi:YebC/PmpR family DNA-binding regulatory protein
MAGHSKWANIRFRKGAQDAKRGKIFTKLVREITQATRDGGADLDTNPKLRMVRDKALRANMTKDSIDRAIAKASGNLEGVSYSEYLYEGYAPGGIAVLVSCLTDNKNRTVGEVRHAFSKFGGALGADGSVSFLFRKVGLIEFKADNLSEEDAFEKLVDMGANDVEVGDGICRLECDLTLLNDIQNQLQEESYELIRAEMTYLPDQTVDISELEQAQKLMKFVDFLEDLDDVQNIYANYEIEQSLLENL